MTPAAPVSATLRPMPRTTRDIVIPPADPAPAPAPLPSPHAASTSHGFETEAAVAVAALSRALAEFLRAIPGSIDSCPDLERALDIDHVLAWRTFRVATAQNPLAVATDVPRAAPMDRLLKAAKLRRVRAAAIETVRTAYADFQDLVRRHAGEDPKRGPGAGNRGGGRTAFDAMISGVQTQSSRKVDLAQRRAMYKTASYVWGLQAHTAVTCAVAHAGAEPDTFDALIISGFVRLHALRSGTPLRLIGRSGVRLDTPELPSARPFDAVGGTIHVLEEFSTRPLPEMSVSEASTGMLETDLRFPGIGKSAAIDIFTAKTGRGSKVSPNEPWHGAVKTIAMPAEVQLIDLLVPVGWTSPRTARVSTHGYPGIVEDLARRWPDFELPFAESVTHLGTSLDTLNCPEVPRYAEMTRSALERLGWASTAFDIFRCRVRYPILHTLVRMRVDTCPPVGR